MLALEKIKVLDLTRAAPGALCTMILGDLGAQILKIEPPPDVGGRAGGLFPPLVGEEQRREAVYYAPNRNKKSLALDLRSEAGREIFYRQVEKADVIVEGFRPGVVKRLGIDYETVKTVNPQIVYCSLTGYGQDGPYSHLPGHDINYISLGGALGLIGGRGDPPTIPLNLVGDFGGGALHGVVGILAALIARKEMGTGQYIDIAYTDSVISLLSHFVSNYFLEGNILRKGGSFFHGVYPYYGVYETKDHKYVSLGCLEPWLWENFCRAIEREDLIPYHWSPEHQWNAPDENKWQFVRSCLMDVFKTKTRDEWFDFLIAKDVPIGKVYTLDEVFSDPQVKHREMIIERDHPSVGTVRQVGLPIKMSESPGKFRRFPSLVGEHTDEVLLEMGYGKPEIDDLRKRGIVW